MRFACQSCGKAYNLPEEKIADKSNVKLKCRVCGAIVEVKRQGEVVAQILAEVDVKRGRVSEAPAPLMSLSPDDADDETHAIAVGDQILAEGNSGPDAAAALLGHVKSVLKQQGTGLVPLPPPPPTGFGNNSFGVPSFGSTSLGPPPSSPLGNASATFGAGTPAPFGTSTPAPLGSGPLPFGATPVPPPLAIPEPPAFGRGEPPAMPYTSSGAPPLPGAAAPQFSDAFGSPPPPLPSAADPVLHNGNGLGSNGLGNGMAPHFGDVMPLPDVPALSAAGATAGTMSAHSPDFPQVAVAPLPASTGDDTTRKMLAALATGILIGYILAQLFS